MKIKRKIHRGRIKLFININRILRIIRELITKIYVGDVRKVDGEKVQSIEIHYRFIGSLSDGAGK